jgi:hypothetical protein
LIGGERSSYLLYQRTSQVLVQQSPAENLDKVRRFMFLVKDEINSTEKRHIFKEDNNYSSSLGYDPTKQAYSQMYNLSPSEERNQIALFPDAQDTQRIIRRNT